MDAFLRSCVQLLIKPSRSSLSLIALGCCSSVTMGSVPSLFRVSAAKPRFGNISTSRIEGQSLIIKFFSVLLGVFAEVVVVESWHDVEIMLSF